MNHNPDAYNEEGFVKNPDKLLEKVNQYFFLTDDELDYDKIKYKFLP